MSVIPNIPVGQCINCGGYPTLQTRLFRDRARLTCACGVSGAWVKPFAWDMNGWNVAARGWRVVARPFPPPPPPTMK